MDGQAPDALARGPDPLERSELRVASFIKRLTVGGDETRLLALAKFIDRSRFHHFVVVAVGSSQDRDALAGAMLQRYEAAGINVQVLNLELGWSHPLNYVRLFVRLIKTLRQRRVDILDARMSLPTVIGGLAARLSGTTAIVSTQYYTSAWSPPFLWVLGQIAFACLVDACVSDALTTIKDFDKWRLSRRASLHLIPNGVVPATPTVSREEVRARLGIPSGGEVKVVGQVSRMIPRKGYETFMRAARQVADKAPETKFLCCGFAEDLSYRMSLVDLARRLGLSNQLVLVSYPGPIGDVLGAIDVFTHLSTEDSSPIAYHESMAAGLPAVVTSLPGNQELFDAGVTALAVPPKDVDATADAILRLLGDSELCARMGAAARQRYLNRHTAEAMAHAHEKLYVQLYDRRRETLGKRPWRRLGRAVFRGQIRY